MLTRFFKKEPIKMSNIYFFKPKHEDIITEALIVWCIRETLQRDISCWYVCELPKDFVRMHAKFGFDKKFRWKELK